MSDFKFGTSKETIQDTSGAPRVTNPFLGKVKLDSVSKREIIGRDETVYPNVLSFVFKTMPGVTDIADKEIGGFTIEKAEWEPREEDDQKKVNNKTGRVGYIMSKFLSEEAAIIDSTQIKSWEHFVDTVVSRFEQQPEAFEKVVKMKSPASEYRGEVSFGIPNYKGFIQSSKEDNALAFSAKEEQANAKWLATKGISPDEAPEETGSFAEDDDLF